MFSLIGIIWLAQNFNSFYFDKILIGFKSLKFPTITNLLLGNGYTASEGSTFFQFFSIFGLIPTIGLISLFSYINWGTLKYLQSKEINRIGLNLSLLITILIFSSYLIIENIGVDLIILLLVLLMTILSIQKQVYLSKKEIEFSKEVFDFASIKEENHRFFYQLLRIFSLCLILFIIIYLLLNLNYINIFLQN